MRVWYTLPIDFCLPDGDKAIRIGELTEDATQGDVIAQFNLGSRYYRGAGVPQDYAQAAHWLQLAAAQGHDEAGELLLMALALNKDYVAAAQCYQKAHHTDTVPDTGVMLYELARTLSYRDPRCVSLLTQATDHGNIQAMQDLTCLYAEVDGLERDEAKAVDFCSQYLRSSGMPCQGITIADVYYHIATDITSDVISSYKRLEYLKASVELGHADAQMVLGKFYYNREDYAEASDSLSRACSMAMLRPCIIWVPCMAVAMVWSRTGPSASIWLGRQPRLAMPPRSAILVAAMLRDWVCRMTATRP